MKGNKVIAWMAAALLLWPSVPAQAQQTATVSLPEALTTVGEEAFYGCAALDRVEVPEGTLAIHAKAYAYSSLKEISLPATVTFIAEDAFEGCADFWVEAPYGSYAYQWAKEKGYQVHEPTPPPGEDELPWIPA